MGDISIKRMMTFLTAICILVTCVICFGATAGICEEINQTQEGPSHTWRGHHHDIHKDTWKRRAESLHCLEKLRRQQNDI